MAFGAKMLVGDVVFGEVPGAALPRRASRLYVMPLTCSTSPPSIVPN